MDGYSAWRIGPFQAFTLMCVAVFTQRIGAAKSLPMLRLASDVSDAVPFGHRILQADPKGVKIISQNVFAVSGRQLARRDSSCLTARVRITESAMKIATPTKTTSTL
jgi:hypothetical protein